MRIVRHVLCTATLSVTVLLAVGTANADEPALSTGGHPGHATVVDAPPLAFGNTVWG